MLRIMAGVNQKDSYAATQFGLFWEIPFSAMFGSTVGTFFVSLRVGLVALGVRENWEFSWR